jgi:hypothetical protein
MVTRPRRRGLRRVPPAAPLTPLALTAVSMVLAACSEGTATSPPQTPVDNPTVSVSTAPTTTPGAVDPVTVQASIGVPSSRAVTALVSFVKAHAESVNAGRVTRRLVSVTTPAELARQQQVVDFAVAQGYVVPSTPVVRIASVLRRSATSESFGTCFWLPSTEYREADSGTSPSGPVPRAWAPAVATLRLANLTWSLDTLTKPDNETTIRCGSNP